MADITTHDRWGLLRDRNFAFLWAGQMISQVGDSLNKVALVWFVYDLTGSTLKTTVIGLLQTIPPLVLAAPIGVYLDRLSKKRVMIWIDLIRAALVLIIPLLHLAGALTLPRLYILVFLISLFSSVFGPALVSSLPLLVARPQLTAANALIQSTTNIGMLAGPAISGAGIALVGAQNVFYVNVVTFLLSALCLAPIRLAHDSSRDMARTGTFLEDALVGFRFVGSHPMIIALMVGASLYSMAASAVVFLLPALAKSHFHMGAMGLGALWSLLGIGMLGASLWLSSLRHRDLCARLRLVSTSLVLGGIAMVALGLLTWTSATMASMVLLGGSLALFTPIIWAFLQELAPTEMLARVLTTFNTAAMAASMAGMLLFGWTADAFAPRASLMGAAMTFFIAAAVLTAFGRRYGFPAIASQPLVFETSVTSAAASQGSDVR
ncbi:MAG TPA: MFS transporter [Nitrospiraceae bacterium]|nr:MFS transporter [Nitrospiraceae bacterium]